MVSVEQKAALLLDDVSGIIKEYEARWQKTGEKYNIFKIAGIADKELIMCRVLADLMNPRGKHCQGSRYLGLFWETIAPKLPEKISLDLEHTKVTVENVIDENRRVDIVLEDGRVFVPIEVKIRAGDQLRQVADYFAFAQRKSPGVHVPLLYLTLDGHGPQDFSKAGVGKDAWVAISFKDEILPWLQACACQQETEAVPPLWENLKQLIAAIKSLCGKSEDAEMEDAIFNLVAEDDDAVRAALAISGAMDFKGRALGAFKDSITALVQKAFHGVVEYKDEDDWHMIQVEVMGGNYVLDVNYDWKSFSIEVCVDKNEERNRQVEKRMAEEMTRWTTQTSAPGEAVFAIYGTGQYPGLESVDEELYFYRLYREYAERPQAAAERIIAIARALESVNP